jgi:hypothetical protein
MTIRPVNVTLDDLGLVNSRFQHYERNSQLYINTTVIRKVWEQNVSEI